MNIRYIMGKFDVHQIGEFYLISALGIGGTVIKEREGMILLDNTYVLRELRISKNFRGNSKDF